MSVDHASAVAAPKSDPVFLHVKAGLPVIVTDTEGAWRMADVILVDDGAETPRLQRCFSWLISIQVLSTGSTPNS